ncbi:unnamed protein product [Tetraodon nigroviridis]|uniref:(spotted green pufferfish) hypothetical protein n=1 Tax=Tetraodon nigroviridis TaxID=99883 RepID=Q4S5J9_TETNG|nr:unnamed protein product [Tetraodon nigroviridis]
MSVAFSSARPRSKGEVTQQTIQKMLDENHHLIQCIMEYQSKGKLAECTQYQQILHRNLVYLATIADSNQNMQSLLPAPPTANMSMGPGATGGHTTGNLNDCVPPTSMMQSQMSNGPINAHMQQHQQSSPVQLANLASSFGSSGYSRFTPTSLGSMIQGPGPGSSSFSRSNLNLQSHQVSMMHQQSATPHYSSAQGGGQHYQGQPAMAMMSQGAQGNSMMSQRPLGTYRSSQQGSAQQYTGQDEFYGEQYGHTQSSSEPINQQYYPDGHGEYSYQQSSYSDQGYERSFEESSQHYYEGGICLCGSALVCQISVSDSGLAADVRLLIGNSQYSQQQAQYQQGSGQPQPFSQQQYSSQQGYGGQPQGYGEKHTITSVYAHMSTQNQRTEPVLSAAGPGQSASSQYSQFQQGQSQQYSSYRSSQGGPGAQAQRSYAYEQVPMGGQGPDADPCALSL